MKTTTLLLLASLAVLSTSARAASSPTENDVVVLPTYVVETPRYLTVEKEVNASLEEMRNLAKVPITVPAAYPALKAAVNQDSMVALKSRTEKTVHIAKL